MSIRIFAVDFVEAEKIMEPHAVALRNLIAGAIATERERCAQIAEGFNAAGKPIAEAIRTLS